MNSPQQVTLTLTVEEANLILEGLGAMPFNKVYQLVGKIQQQASQQLQGQPDANGHEEPTPSAEPVTSLEA